MEESISKSVIDREPKTLNTLQPNEFRVVFHRIPNLVYFCQKANLPGITINESNFPSPYATPIRHPMGGLVYENFEMEFLVSEDMKNWKELHDWITKIPPTKDFLNAYNDYHENFSDATLVIMNSMSKPILAVHFRDCYPSSLGSMDFQTSVSDISPVLCTVSFGFTGYYIENLTAV